MRVGIATDHEGYGRGPGNQDLPPETWFFSDKEPTSGELMLAARDTTGPRPGVMSLRGRRWPPPVIEGHGPGYCPSLGGRCSHPAGAPHLPLVSWSRRERERRSRPAGGLRRPAPCLVQGMDRLGSVPFLAGLGQPPGAVPTDGRRSGGTPYYQAAGRAGRRQRIVELPLPKGFSSRRLCRHGARPLVPCRTPP